jgi:hypothetical protein
MPIPMTDDQNPAPAPAGGIGRRRCNARGHHCSHRERAQRGRGTRRRARGRDRRGARALRGDPQDRQPGQARRGVGAQADRGRHAGRRGAQGAFTAMTRADGEFEIDGTLRIGAGDDERDKRIRGASRGSSSARASADAREGEEEEPELFEGVDFGGGNSFRGYRPSSSPATLLEQRRREDARHGQDAHARPRVHAPQSSYQTRATSRRSSRARSGQGAARRLHDAGDTWQRFCGTDDVPDFRPSEPLPHRLAAVAAVGRRARRVQERHHPRWREVPDQHRAPRRDLLAVARGDHQRRHGRPREPRGRSSAALHSARSRTTSTRCSRRTPGLGPTHDGRPAVLPREPRERQRDGLRDLGRRTRRGPRCDARAEGPERSRLPQPVARPPARAGRAQGHREVLNDAQYDPDTANKLQRPNMVRGLFSDIIGTPRLAANTTRRYLFADPAQCAAIVVAFLEGYGMRPDHGEPERLAHRRRRVEGHAVREGAGRATRRAPSRTPARNRSSIAASSPSSCPLSEGLARGLGALKTRRNDHVDQLRSARQRDALHRTRWRRDQGSGYPHRWPVRRGDRHGGGGLAFRGAAKGVWTLPKTAGEAWTVEGNPVFWDVANGKFIDRPDGRSSDRPRSVRRRLDR